MDTIYRKTAKGAQEIGTRAFGLPPRLRSTLILVDGQRSASALRQLVGASCDEYLRALNEQGFVEPAAQAAPVAAPRAPAAAPPAPAAPAAPAPGVPHAPAAPAVPFEMARRDAVRELVDRVGPMGESLAIRMERTRNAGELAALLDTAAQIIANVRGAGAAQAYLQRHRPG
jgi:hypothetical protein